MWLMAQLAGCGADVVAPAPEVLPPLVAGAPVVGAASGVLRLPVGTPLSGYTGRCTCLLAEAVDDRQSAYNTAFIESVGIQTLPSIDAVWIENGDDVLLWTKTDTIYSFDGLVAALEKAVGAAVGRDMVGRVIHTANHSHAAWGTFSDQSAFYLGSDGFNAENFARMVGQITDVSVSAWNAREPAKLGVSWHRDWDGDMVTHDRRPENDALVVWPDMGAEQGGKDPWLGVIRIDALDGRPLAAIFNFGMHGTVLGEDNPLASYEAPGAVETAFAELDGAPPVVMVVQGAGGDVSASAEQGDFAAVESVGERAAPLLWEAYVQTPVASDPLLLETVARSLPQLPEQIHVTRGGEVDWFYLPYEEDRFPDGRVYGDDGSILSPLDEFNTPFGAAFCGTGDLDLPVGRLPTDVFPYSNCLDIELISLLVNVYFKLPDGEPALPLLETTEAAVTVSRIGPLATRLGDGTDVTQDLLVGFFPGEVTSMASEMWRRRAAAEAGFQGAMTVGYAQDHEGYILIAEDWLLGGYEPDIGVWGPLQGDAILEGAVHAAAEVLTTDVREGPNPAYDPTPWPERPLATPLIDATPEAGTLLTEAPEGLWLPLGIPADLSTPAVVPRVGGMVQLGWLGGDPAVDSPIVTLQRQKDGVWADVLDGSGRPVSEAGHDILLVWLPTPLYPAEGPQTHAWVALWQAVGHGADRRSLEEGTYRLMVNGQRFSGTEATWPRTTAPYTVEGPEFEVVAGAIDVAVDENGLSVSLTAPGTGFRLVALGGDHRGDNPVVGPVTVSFSLPGGDEEVSVVEPVMEGHRSRLAMSIPEGWTAVEVVDGAGNGGAALP